MSYLCQGLAEDHEVTLLYPQFRDEQIVPEESSLSKCCKRTICVPVTRTPSQQNPGHFFWAPAGTRALNLFNSRFPSVVRYRHIPAMQQALNELALSDSFDVVWATRCHLAESAKRAGFSRIVVDVDDVPSVLLAQDLADSGWYASKPLHILEMLKTRWYERKLPRRFNRIVVCKDQDRQLFGKDAEQVRVVPNGVCDLPLLDGRTEKCAELLFVGSMGYPPNEEAALYFADTILPLIRTQMKEASVSIVGRQPAERIKALAMRAGVAVSGDVPEIQPYYEQAAVVVVPLRKGSGTRLKILEALAFGKAVVSTSLGAEGLDLRPGVDLEIADDPGLFAETCVRLLRDRLARERLGLSGRNRVLSQYAWDQIGRIAISAVG